MHEMRCVLSVARSQQWTQGACSTCCWAWAWHVHRAHTVRKSFSPGMTSPASGRRLLRRYPDFPDMRAALAAAEWGAGLGANAEADWVRYYSALYCSRGLRRRRHRELLERLCYFMRPRRPLVQKFCMTRVHAAVEPLPITRSWLRCVQNRVEDPRYSDRSWLRGTRRWPPRLCTALEARPGRGFFFQSAPCDKQRASLHAMNLSALCLAAGFSGHQGSEWQLSPRECRPACEAAMLWQP